MKPVEPIPFEAGWAGSWGTNDPSRNHPAADKQTQPQHLGHPHHGFDTTSSFVAGRLNQLHHLQAGWAGTWGTNDPSRNHPTPATMVSTRPAPSS